MDSDFEQWVLVDTLLENWDGIRVRMGPLPPTLNAALQEATAALAAASQAGQSALALDRLLDLTEDTAAYGYVRQLIQRCTLPTRGATRGAIGEQARSALAAPGLVLASAQLAAAARDNTGFHTVPAFFVTNRKDTGAGNNEDRFGGEYAKEVTYGRAQVTIPTQAHRIGHIERPLPWIGREQADRHVVLTTPETVNRDGFASLLATDMALAPRKELLVFLHGYRVTFEEAARRAAQVAHDIRFDGVVLLFSWPSAGTLMAYAADGDSAAKSAEPLRQLLRDLEGGPWSHVHVLAHSMGNRVLVSGLGSPEQGWTLPIQNVVMVAADVELDLFEQKFPFLRQRVNAAEGGLVTSYASGMDRALGISAWLHRGSRLGRVGDSPLALEGLESIDATATDTSLLALHHGYFAERRSLLTDLGLLVRERLPAARRGLAPVHGKWWMFQP